MKKIGKHFEDELAAAHLAGLPFSWGADGEISFGPAITPEQRAAILSVYEAHDPDNPDSQLVQIAQAKRDLAATDSAIARITEDLIVALAAKGLINPEIDLPTQALAKLASRKAARAKLI